MCLLGYRFYQPPDPPPTIYLNEEQRRDAEERARREADRERVRAVDAKLAAMYAERDRLMAKRAFWLRVSIKVNNLTAAVLEWLGYKPRED